jgi:hypothetical protein
MHDELRARNDLRLRQAIMPHLPLHRDGAALLRESLESGPGSVRRKAIFSFVKKSSNSWERPPDMDEEHWNDLHVGSLLFRARDAAIGALNSVECHIPPGKSVSLDQAVAQEDTAQYLEDLRRFASNFLANYRDQHMEAKNFCKQSEGNDTDVLRGLVRRDGICLALLDDIDMIVPGPMFLGAAIGTPPVDGEEEAAPATEDTSALPEGISHRVRNAHALHRDLA